MLRPPSLLGAQTSGFVPFGAGGSVHGDLDEPARKSSPSTLRVAAPAPPVDVAASVPEGEAEAAPWRQAGWEPVASGRVRLVEASVLVAIAGYFALGLVKLAGWL